MNSKLAAGRPLFCGLVLFGALCSSPLAQPVLTGFSLYNADSIGAYGEDQFWDTVGDNNAFNIYVFTGSESSPVWLNGGDDSSLNPNYLMSIGTITLNLRADATLTSSPYLGLNVWFDGGSIDAGASNRITAHTLFGGGNGLTQTGAGIDTYAYANTSNNGHIPSVGSLSYLTGGYLVTLTSFSANTASTNLVGATAIGSSQYYPVDTAVTLTFNVSAVPEPADTALWLSAAALAGLIWHRRRHRAAA